MLVLADLLALFHGLFVLPLVFVAPVVLLLAQKRYLWLEWAFIVTVVLTVLSFAFTGSCFLTTWEQQLRVAAGAPSFEVGFIQHYAAKIGIYLPGMVTMVTAIILFVAGIGRIVFLNIRDNRAKRSSAGADQP